jgi:DNA polymerase-3 subunit alpha
LHPLDPYRDLLTRLAPVPIGRLLTMHDRSRVEIAGIVTQTRSATTRKGEPMGIFTIEDHSGKTDALLFGDALRRHRDLFAADAQVWISGRLGARDGQPPRLFAENAASLAALSAGRGLSLHLAVGEQDEERLVEICGLLASHPGEMPVFLHVDPDAPHGAIVQLRHHSVLAAGALLETLEASLGHASVRIVFGTGEKLRSGQVFSKDASAGSTAERVARERASAGA